jgi:CheY-like chemotaxis protein
VLVVDDHVANRDLARQLLEARGAAVSEAPGGAEALQRLARKQFDVVLLDLRMPRVDGREVLKRLRRGGHGRNREVPVVAFTADVDVTAADPAGFAGLVRKPVSAADLCTVIARACGRT